MTIPALTPCNDPILASTTGEIVTLANGNRVSGFIILGSGTQSGIYGKGINGAFISDNKFFNCDTGIFLEGIQNGSFEISCNEISQGGYGLEIEAVGGSPFFTIAHNRINNNGENGMLIVNSNDVSSKYSIECNHVCNNGSTGLEIECADDSTGEIDLSYNEVCNNEGRGINIDNRDNCALTYLIEHNLVNHNEGIGVKLENHDDSNIESTIKCNTIYYNSDSGLVLEGNDDSICEYHICSNDVVGNGDRGINIDNRDSSEADYFMKDNKMFANGDSLAMKIENHDSGKLFLEASGNYSDKEIELENAGDDSSTYTVKAEDLDDFKDMNNFDDVTETGIINYSP